VAFVIAGCVPLTPYVLPVPVAARAPACIVMTAAALFGVGAARGAVSKQRWWITGLEMLALGAIVAGAAYGAGNIVASLIGWPPE
jgi:VIT1/CCC1 family predicted Fe2+/Mn2+ transporter